MRTFFIGETMKIIDIFMVISVAILLFFITMIFFPIKLSAPVAIENKKLHKHEEISYYISKFKEREGRIPNSVKEIDISMESVHKVDFSKMAIRNKNDGRIIDYTDRSIVFEVEAVWLGRYNEELAWAKTKSGDVIRFRKEIFHQQQKNSQYD